MKKILFPLLIFLITISYSQNPEQIEKVVKKVNVYDICSDKDGIWIATSNKGIYHISKKDGEIKNYSTYMDNLQMDLFYCITSNDRFVWAGSVDGLFIFDKKRKSWSKRKFGKGGQYSNWIRSIEYDKHINSVWIGRFKYLTKYDISRRRFTDYDLTVRGNEKTNTIKRVKVDGDSLVWFGTEAGLHKYQKAKRFESDGAVHFYDNRLNYFNGEGKTVSISDLLFEQSNIWIGLDEFVVPGNENYNIGGIYRYDRKNDWWRFDKKDGLAGNGIFALERTGNYIWASLYQFDPKNKEPNGRGLFLINRLTKEIRQVFHEKIPATIFSMHFDGENMWLGTDDGLIKIEMTNDLAKWN